MKRRVRFEGKMQVENGIYNAEVLFGDGICLSNDCGKWKSVVFGNETATGLV
jgi:hypothetical protein